MALVESAESARNARDDKGGFLVAGRGGFRHFTFTMFYFCYISATGETLYLKQKEIKGTQAGQGVMIEYR